MKTKFNYLLVLLLAIPLVFVNCSSDDDDPVLVSGFSLKNKDGGVAEFALTTGDKVTQQELGLVITVAPDNASNKSYTITGDDVVKVTATAGVYSFEALKAGKATITVKAADTDAKAATFTINVADKVILVTDITLSNSEGDVVEFTLTAEDKVTQEELGLVVTVTPDNADDKSYTITGDEVVEVTESEGVYSFEALKVGEATITVKANGAGDTDVSKTFKITVTPKIVQFAFDADNWVLGGNSEDNTEGGGYKALFDGSTDTYWHSLKTRQTPPFEIYVDFSSVKEIDHVVVKRRVHEGNVWPVAKIVEVSTSLDGVEYTDPVSHDFGDFSNISMEVDLEYTFKLSQLTKAQYIKIVVLEVNANGKTKHASLSEIEIYGAK